jgi:SAM-dependent methyltransferase
LNPELIRLLTLGWKLPTQDTDGIFTPLKISEDKISFPSENYTGEEANPEADGFWAEVRAKSIWNLLHAHGVSTLWEIGAGNGNAAIPLRKQGIEVLPIEPLRSGAVTLTKNGFTTFQATLESLNFPDNSIGAIGAFDVIEHLENPNELMDEVYRILKAGGMFICSVPAYQWLFSDFDKSIGHYRRYSRKSLRELVESTGLEVVSVLSLFSYLVLPAYVLRRIPFLLGWKNNYSQIPTFSGGNSQILDRLRPFFGFLGRLERLVEPPFGLSIILISKKSN